MAKIKHERMIGLTDAIDVALGMVEEFTGLKPTTYCRQAIREKLVRDGLLQPPSAHFKNNNNTVQTVLAG